MPEILAIDHVAITARDLEESCAFYDHVFGLRVHVEHARVGQVLVRQVLVGGALLSIHQVGNGVELVADRPTVGAMDLCFRWSGDVASAIAHLRAAGVDVIAGPAPRRASDGMRAQSVYFHDPDKNLLELICAD
jgi:catechol 2,3-dioxygenase-like lactoylglutathione lyase family enzyme